MKKQIKPKINEYRFEKIRGFNSGLILNIEGPTPELALRQYFFETVSELIDSRINFSTNNKMYMIYNTFTRKSQVFKASSGYRLL